MPTIFLHIGQGKAGSTAIQRFLEINAGLLREYGLTNCPLNIVQWPGSLEAWGQLILEAIGNAPKNSNDLILSQEWLFSHMNDPVRLKSFVSNLPEGFDLKMVLYIRDFIPLLCSAYSEEVRRSSFLGSIDTYVARVLREWPESKDSLLNAIKAIRSLGLDLTIRKYKSQGLIEDFMTSLLGEDKARDYLAKSQFCATPSNRGLTRGEIEFLQYLKQFGVDQPTIKGIGLGLADRVPDVASEKPYLGPGLLTDLEQQLRHRVHAINRLVDPDHHLATDFSVPRGWANEPDNGVYHFNKKQLELITHSIASKIRESDDKIQGLNHEIQELEAHAAAQEARKLKNRLKRLIKRLIRGALRAARIVPK